MQQAGREKEKERYRFWAPDIYCRGCDVLPEQTAAAAADVTPFSKQFTAYAPGQ